MILGRKDKRGEGGCVRGKRKGSNERYALQKDLFAMILLLLQMISVLQRYRV